MPRGLSVSTGTAIITIIIIIIIMTVGLTVLQKFVHGTVQNNTVSYDGADHYRGITVDTGHVMVALSRGTVYSV